MSTTPLFVDIFVVVAAVAIVIQAAVMVAMYAAFKKTSTRVESLAARVESLTGEIQTRVLPTVEAVSAFVLSNRPKLEAIVDNLTTTSTTVRSQVGRVSATLDDVLDRTRLQVVRADELISRTMDRVEETTEIVQRSVISPVRMASGVLQGLTVGFGALLHRKRQPGSGSHEEMFI